MLTAEERRQTELRAAPLKSVPFSLRDLKDAVPAEYFEASMSTSWYYIAKDIAQFGCAAIATSLLLAYLPPSSSGWLPCLARVLVWLLYGFIQGTTGFGLWVIGHECGHQAYFGRRKSLNNAVGMVIHSAMLVPFHSWGITHGTHHRFTNHLQKDTAFPPPKEPSLLVPLYELVPFLEFLHFITYLVLGFPIYLTLNWAGQWYPSQWCNHFWPYAPIFQPHQRRLVVLSDIAFGAFVLLLVAWSYQFGFSSVFCWYLLPWFFCNAWLVTVTLLQHSSPQVPHYDGEEWEFVKGALSTVDRDYGIFNSWLHHITNGHVAHHLFSTMPFYHAIKATPYLARRMGSYYKTDKRPLWVQAREAFHHHVYSYLVWRRYPDEVSRS